MNEVACSHAFLAFQLYLQDFQCTFSASDKQTIALGQEFSGNERTLRQCRIPNMQVLSSKRSEDARPRMEPAQPIANLSCGESKVNTAIFFFQNWREACLCIILPT